MTATQSDPVFFDCVKTEHSLARYKLFPRGEPFQILSLARHFVYWAGGVGRGGACFIVFRLHGLPVVTTANGSLEQDRFKWSCQISHLWKNLF